VLERGVGEVRLPEIAASQVGASEVCATQVGSREARGAEVLLGEDGVMQIAIGEVASWVSERRANPFEERAQARQSSLLPQLQKRAARHIRMPADATFHTSERTSGMPAA